MRLWTSFEVSRQASPALDRSRRCVESYLDRKFSNSSLIHFDCTIQYIPLVMDGEFKSHVKSQVIQSDFVCCCAPKLDHDTFVDGTFRDQLQEYVRGLAECAPPYLSELGASEEQLRDFNLIMSRAVDEILEADPDRTMYITTLRGREVYTPR